MPLQRMQRQDKIVLPQRKNAQISFSRLFHYIRMFSYTSLLRVGRRIENG